MPYSAKGFIFYAENGEVATLEHGQPVRVDGINGVAIKQVNSPITAGVTAADVIAKKEVYAVLTKGVVEVADPSEGELLPGNIVYITEENKLTENEKEGEGEEEVTNTAFGRVVEVDGDRGTAADHIRVDLDLG